MLGQHHWGENPAPPSCYEAMELLQPIPTSARMAQRVQAQGFPVVGTARVQSRAGGSRSPAQRAGGAEAQSPAGENRSNNHKFQPWRAEMKQRTHTRQFHNGEEELPLDGFGAPIYPAGARPQTSDSSIFPLLLGSVSAHRKKELLGHYASSQNPIGTPRGKSRGKNRTESRESGKRKQSGGSLASGGGLASQDGRNSALSNENSDHFPRHHHKGHCPPDCPQCHDVELRLNKFDKHWDEVLQKREDAEREAAEREAERQRKLEQFLPSINLSASARRVDTVEEIRAKQKLEQQRTDALVEQQKSEQQQKSAEGNATEGTGTAGTSKTTGDVGSRPPPLGDAKSPTPALATDHLSLKPSKTEVSENPLTGLLCGIPLHRIVAAYDHLFSTNTGQRSSGELEPGSPGYDQKTRLRNFREKLEMQKAGGGPIIKQRAPVKMLSFEEFSKLLRRLVPGLRLSTEYGLSMFNPFVPRSQTMLPRRVELSAILKYLAKYTGSLVIEANLRFFFRCFDIATLDPQSGKSGYISARVLQGSVIRAWAENRVIGTAIYNWRLVAAALEETPVEMETGELAGNKEQPSGVGSTSITIANLQRQHREPSSYANLTLDDLRIVIHSSEKLAAAFSKGLDCAVTDAPRFPLKPRPPPRSVLSRGPPPLRKPSSSSETESTTANQQVEHRGSAAGGGGRGGSNLLSSMRSDVALGSAFMPQRERRAGGGAPFDL